MRCTTRAMGIGLPMLMVLLMASLAPTRCRPSADRSPGAPATASMAALDPPAVAAKQPPPAAAAPNTSVMVYIKIVIDRQYGVLARVMGGMRDNTWERTVYDAASPWWRNPLIIFADPPLLDPDVVARADAQIMTGRGASANVAVQVRMVPHADVAIQSVPPASGIRGTLTITVSTLAEYYDGRWVRMVKEDDLPMAFTFDTCDTQADLEPIGTQVRSLPVFLLERYTRDEVRWEPRGDWPSQPRRGDWRVVIHGRDARLEVTSYRHAPRAAVDTWR